MRKWYNENHSHGKRRSGRRVETQRRGGDSREFVISIYFVNLSQIEWRNLLQDFREEETCVLKSKTTNEIKKRQYHWFCFKNHKKIG